MSDGADTLAGNAIVEWLTGTIAVRLKELAQPLRLRFPGVRIQMFGGPVGSRTEFQGYHVGVEADLPSGDGIGLSVCAAYLTTAPRVLGDVCWDAPGGTIEATTCEDWLHSSGWPLATTENLRRVEQELPRLVDALAVAIERGRRPES
jgi:hypothetical protein